MTASEGDRREPAPADSDLAELLADEVARGDAALARTETKTSILLAVLSPIVTAGVAVLPRSDTSPPATAAFWAALGLLTAALLLLLWNVRPRLRGSGFATYARMSDADLQRHFVRAAEDPVRWHRERLLVIARVGAVKFGLLRTATQLVGAAVLVAVAAAVLAAATA
ncbi:Pycsar system effector family protein [Prauserella muralis]|uniref:Pycsar effector protein domain-containing protein n=1 Tax=Prauserella muralis TaxID=588067 RepID=A0A2V4AT53_9PSEU|nr:Pycsar system effector family protein [Prauserella muralis]PXY22721.1 hypothetical protein BAY60_23220 [Prauserella muralis]TWE28444.1 hypothetical protein FHX69_1100 [Prauserella muralis]